MAAALAPLRERLPASHLGWRFVDAVTFVLPLGPGTAGALWLELRPPEPRLTLARDASDARAGPFTPFQAQLKARATGPLKAVLQAALDRRCTLRFGASGGFVPSPTVWLEVELTGRHANAVLRDASGRILGVVREVGADVNRHRQLRPGLAYRPPPPYSKLDPRSATPAALAAALEGVPISRAHRHVDGVGKTLSGAWARAAGVDAQQPLEGSTLERALQALRHVADDPFGALAAFGAGGPSADLEPAEARRAAALEGAREAARARLEDRRALLR